MIYDDVKDIALNVARKFAGGTFCVTALVMVSLYRSVPEPHVWLACVLAAGAAYFVVGAAALHYYVVLLAPPPSEVLFPGPAPVSSASPVHRIDATAPPLSEHPADVIRAHAPEWADEVDWAKLHALVRQPDAPLSRAALDGIVDQRFYSPREGDDTMPFPELMVRIGAAMRITNGGGQPSYAWSSSASRIVARVWQSFNEPSSNGSPTPLAA